MNYNKVDLSYAAGLIDGEGCIGVYRNKNPQLLYGGSYRLNVQIGMSDSAPLEFMYHTFGGYFLKVGGRKEEYKTRYMWGIATKQAGKFLEALLPYLRGKKEQAKIAITFQLRRNPGGSKPTKGQYEEDIKTSILLKEMKRRQ